MTDTVRILTSGAYMLRGDRLVNVAVSPAYYLDFQTDSNLVLYRSGMVYFDPSLPANDPHNQPAALWATSTNGLATPPVHLQLWVSGNLTLYADGWNQIWTAPLYSGINNPIAGSELRIDNNGQLIIRAPDGTVNWRCPGSP